MAVWSYLLEGEGVGECEEKHCGSLWCRVGEVELSCLQLPQ